MNRHDIEHDCQIALTVPNCEFDLDDPSLSSGEITAYGTMAKLIHKNMAEPTHG